MPKTDAQKRAQKNYADKHRGEYKVFQTGFKVGEAERIEATLKNYNISKADLVRRAAERLTQGDNLTGWYDPESGRIVHAEESDEA